jgi:hypothetical protein
VTASSAMHFLRGSGDAAFSLLGGWGTVSYLVAVIDADARSNKPKGKMLSADSDSHCGSSAETSRLPSFEGEILRETRPGSGDRVLALDNSYLGSLLAEPMLRPSAPRTDARAQSAGRPVRVSPERYASGDHNVGRRCYGLP